MDQKPKDLERQIIEAAKGVFVRKGYEATRISDIAKEVGISRTALHYYFRTKDMLFDAIFGQLLESFLPNISIIMQKEEPLLEKIPKLIDKYAEVINENRFLPLFIVNEVNRDPEQLYQTILKSPNRYQPIIELQEKVREEMDKGLLKKVPLEEVVTTIISIIVFPLLMQNPLMGVFMDGNKKKFDIFYEKRKEMAKRVMFFLLTPDNTNS